MTVVVSLRRDERAQLGLTQGTIIAPSFIPAERDGYCGGERDPHAHAAWAWHPSNLLQLLIAAAWRPVRGSPAARKRPVVASIERAVGDQRGRVTICTRW